MLVRSVVSTNRIGIMENYVGVGKIEGGRRMKKGRGLEGFFSWQFYLYVLITEIYQAAMEPGTRY